MCKSSSLSDLSLNITFLHQFKGTVSVISNDPPYKDVNGPLKP